LAGILLINFRKIEKLFVMMKKKMRDNVDLKQNNTDRATDNIENTGDSVNYAGEVTGKTDAPEATGNILSDTVNDNFSTDKVNVEVRVVEEKLAEMQDKYIRLSAEFDNYRKRTLREKMEMSKYAGESLMLNIIPVMDDFERALRHMEVTDDCTAIKDGIGIIYGKFSEFLKQNGVKEIESLNHDFNVDLHEAVAKVPVEDADKKGKVVDVVLKGYYLQDKVLRFSKVIVGE
jgi:molecular chaperone GrpE